VEKKVWGGSVLLLAKKGHNAAVLKEDGWKKSRCDKGESQKKRGCRIQKKNKKGQLRGKGKRQNAPNQADAEKGRADLWRTFGGSPSTGEKNITNFFQKRRNEKKERGERGNDRDEKSGALKHEAGKGLAAMGGEKKSEAFGGDIKIITWPPANNRGKKKKNQKKPSRGDRSQMDDGKNHYLST